MGAAGGRKDHTAAAMMTQLLSANYSQLSQRCRCVGRTPVSIPTAAAAAAADPLPAGATGTHHGTRDVGTRDVGTWLRGRRSGDTSEGGTSGLYPGTVNTARATAWTGGGGRGGG